jgi:hypothetical protein
MIHFDLETLEIETMSSLSMGENYFESQIFLKNKWFFFSYGTKFF